MRRRLKNRPQRSVRMPRLPRHSHQFSLNEPHDIGLNDRSNLTTKIQIRQQSKLIKMLNLNRKVTRAVEDTTNAVRRDTAAKLKAVRALRELPDDVDSMLDAEPLREAESVAKGDPAKPKSPKK